MRKADVVAVPRMFPREGGDPDWAPAFAGEQGGGRYRLGRGGSSLTDVVGCFVHATPDCAQLLRSLPPSFRRTPGPMVADRVMLA